MLLVDVDIKCPIFQPPFLDSIYIPEIMHDGQEDEIATSAPGQVYRRRSAYLCYWWFKYVCGTATDALNAYDNSQ